MSISTCGMCLPFKDAGGLDQGRGLVIVDSIFCIMVIKKFLYFHSV